LDLTPVNDAPTAAPVDLGAIAEDGSRVITSAELLAGVSDVDGPAATITGVSIQSGNGSLADNGDGTWTYTPAANDDTSVTFGYTASDGSLSAASTASLDLTPVNDAPVISGTTTGTVTEPGGVLNAIAGTPTATGDLDAEDADDGDADDAWNTTVVTQGQYGSLTIDAAGHWTYVLATNNATVNALNNGDMLQDSIVVETTDGTQQTITIDIAGSTDEPIVSVYSSSAMTSLVASYDTASAFSDALANALAGQAIVVDHPEALLNVGAQTIETDNLTVVASGAFLADLALSGDARNLTLQGSADINVTASESGGTIVGNAGNNTLSGQGGDDILQGNAGADVLIGGEGADTLNGGAGIDTLTGGNGNDTYYVDNAADVVVEAGGQGNDIVAATVSYALAAGVSVERLNTTSQASTYAINLSGNEFAQTLIGNAGDNVLNGKGGADTMRGLDGNDTYYVDNAGDVIVEADGQGSDIVATSVSYTLAAGVSVERMNTTSQGGTSALNLTGNEFAQTLIGNAGDNILNGKGGADTMRGLDGNDIYYVDNVGDVIVEADGQGSDIVAVTTSYTLAAGVSVERMNTTSQSGTYAINLTGNEFAQTLIGNNGDNILNGKGGADTMRGYAGNDIYYVDNANDVIIETSAQGDDIVAVTTSYTLAAGVSVERMNTTSQGGTSAINLTGNAFDQTLIGNAGDNILNGKGGADTLRGNGGNDTFVFDTALGASNVDAIADYSVTADKIALSQSVFGMAIGALDQNAFHVGTGAADASDRIIYDSASGNLYFDADGNASGVAVLFARLSTGLSVTHDGFTII
ncbi:cadherin-like domain-containing protein, partial [Mesorhizobium yinganensis]|uniref:cadherin-like domain-containing protein n=1 Tax=Mesorhizobium yinganensis TaxID=3157707 RepID=UPI0032B73F83